MRNSYPPVGNGTVYKTSRGAMKKYTPITCVRKEMSNIIVKLVAWTREWSERCGRIQKDMTHTSAIETKY